MCLREEIRHPPPRPRVVANRRSPAAGRLLLSLLSARRGGRARDRPRPVISMSRNRRSLEATDAVNGRAGGARRAGMI